MAFFEESLIIVVEVELFRGINLVLFFLLRRLSLFLLLNLLQLHLFALLDFTQMFVLGSWLGVLQERNTDFSRWKERHVPSLYELDELLLFLGHSAWVAQHVA